MKIQITGGYVGEVSVLVRDRKGSDLSTAGLKMMLLPLGAALPAKNDVAWLTPSSVQYWGVDEGGWNDGGSRARVSLVVSTGGGKYHAWVLASLSPLAVPVLCENEVIELV